METQIINDNSCIRVINDGTPLLIIKTQVKTIDTVKNDMVRIDIGEGALKHIYIRFADVIAPAGLADVSALRDAIKGMLDGAQAGVDLTPLTTLMQGCCKSQTDNLNAVKTSVDALTQQVTANGNTEAQNVTAVKQSVDTLTQQVTADGNTQTQNLAAVKQSVDALGQTVTAQSAQLDGIRQEVVNSGKTQATVLNSVAQTLGQINQALATALNNISQPVRVDESVPMVVYNGFANSGGAATADPVWAIQRITRNGDMYIYEWANGNKQYASIWDNRYNLNYLPAGQ